MQTMFEIAPANTATLQAIVDIAKASGQIDRDALVSMAETVRREEWMRACAAYLASKQITADEKAQIESLMTTMRRNDQRALGQIAAPYKRGDIQQMVDVLRQLPLKKVETRIVDAAAEQVNRPYSDATTARLDKATELLERYGVKVDLKTVRIQRGKP